MGQAPQSGQGLSFKIQPSQGLKLAVAGVSRPDRNWGMSWLGWSRSWGQEAWWLCLLVCVVQTRMCHLGEVVLALAELHRER